VKTILRASSALLLLLALTSCRTTVPGPAFIIRVVSLGAMPVSKASIGSIRLEFVADRMHPDVHFSAVPDTTLDGGIMESVSPDGRFQVTFPGDYIRANALGDATTPLQVPLPFYSLDNSAGQRGYSPQVTAHVNDRDGNEFATGTSFLPWPLDEHIDGGSPAQLAVQCKMDATSQMRCAGM